MLKSRSSNQNIAKPGFRDSVKVSFAKAQVSGGLATVGL